MLIVLSSESILPLKDGHTFKTGYYLNELIVLARRFSAAGYELVFADPTGNIPPEDQASVSPDYFNGSKVKLDQALKYQSSLDGLKHPTTLRWAADHDLNQYAAVFVPGGPAPMIDLMADRNLGRILTYFHTHAKTTALLCHATIALLSTTRNPELEQAALRVGDLAKARMLASNWPYRNYRLTVFSDDEEEQAAKNVFHAKPQFLPAMALKNAGGQVSTIAAWHSKVVRDRELVTGQNPFSDTALMDVVLPIMQGKQ
ncbi:type 1 glutamine amidotransferase domain-containing protein [Lichenicola cladoniae]|uniref:Type 1 glutamine amidotransferase domain-containing protein n=1 Tax=Lichenicola cladoniae TaxID=1484109 RepID=A0A6M8HLR5_9PROT|nr:type 1 glutamine amidotransferase domain-containing protein [Lichenicola cladoniae]NPD70157.1 type 1 glutamine amidotransferase domain-containing protein [Acetobacteraceae bacterium]QKE89275.1 type 1 glutamine amidotransferase domain-containing protein [Lichenicola cladoniae]